MFKQLNYHYSSFNAACYHSLKSMKLQQCTRNLMLNVSVLDLVFTSINQYASNAEPQSDQQEAKYLKPPRTKHLIPTFSP